MTYICRECGEDANDCACEVPTRVYEACKECGQHMAQCLCSLIVLGVPASEGVIGIRTIRPEDLN